MQGGIRRTRSLRRVITVMAAALCLLAGIAGPSNAYPRPGRTVMITINHENSGGAHSQFGLETDVDARGRFVAIYSDAPDLVQGDLNLAFDTFVRDVKKGVTELVSRPNSGLMGIGPPPVMVYPGFSARPSISASGRTVAMVSDHINLVPGDLNLLADVFVHDPEQGIERVSVSSEEEEANGVSDAPDISGDGRFVVFQSVASNLVPDDGNDKADIFVRDRKTHTTRRISVASSGEEGNGPSGYPSVDTTGRYVAFQSSASNLVENDTNGWGDVFLHDLRTSKTERVSLKTGGGEAQEAAYSDKWGPTVSANGRYVLFTHGASSLVPNKGNFPNASDAYVYDRQRKRVERVSVSSSGEAAPGVFNTNSDHPSISDDGRFITFDSGATNFTPDDAETPGDYDVFRHDRRTGATELVSIGQHGHACGGTAPRLSGDGRYAAFVSTCTDLVAGDGDPGTTFQVYLRDIGLPMGISGFGGSPGGSPEDGICLAETCIPQVCVPPVCLPPGGAVSRSDTDRLSEALTELGADLYGVSLAYRPQYRDLFAAIELEFMPPVLPSISPIFYGLRFEVDNMPYEVRATSLLGGTFGLFNCTGACTKVADLRGGYGTTGMRVVFSLPLHEIGLEDGGEIREVKAFSALGSPYTDAGKVLDSVRLD